MNKENLTAYEVVTEEELTDIHSKGWLLRHKKTGARVMLIENDDENKVFNIAFRTPPKDSVRTMLNALKDGAISLHEPGKILEYNLPDRKSVV